MLNRRKLVVDPKRAKFYMIIMKRYDDAIVCSQSPSVRLSRRRRRYYIIRVKKDVVVDSGIKVAAIWQTLHKNRSHFPSILPANRQMRYFLHDLCNRPTIAHRSYFRPIAVAAAADRSWRGNLAFFSFFVRDGPTTCAYAVGRSVEEPKRRS